MPKSVLRLSKFQKPIPRKLHLRPVADFQEIEGFHGVVDIDHYIVYHCNVMLTAAF